MGDNASLDDFLGGESSEQSEAADAAESAGNAEKTDATADVEPAATTYAWDGAGAACAACDETVERRWQQDGDLVCIGCKDWEQP